MKKQFLYIKQLVLNFFVLRGSHETNSPDNVASVLSATENCIRKFLRLPDDMKVSADCDAFSVLITIEHEQNHIDAEIKKSIKELMYHFGTEMGSISIPKAPVAMQTHINRRKDSMFGSKHVKMNHSDTLLFMNEALVVDTPVKIAVHRDCREAIVNEFGKRHFPCGLSSNKGICIDTNNQTALPPYGMVLDILLENCYVSNAKKHIIHFGDLGTRFPIKLHNEGTCHMQELFNKIQSLREKCSVQVCQLDIAYNIHVKDRLIRWSLKEKNSCNKGSILYGFSRQVWPMHDIEAMNGNVATEKNQKGGLLFKHTDWGEAKGLNVLNNLSDDGEPVIGEEQYDLIDSIYKKTSNGNTEESPDSKSNKSLIANTSDIHSVKLYSSVRHPMGRSMHKLPMKYDEFEKLPCETMIHLKRILMRLLDQTSKGMSHVQNNGVMARIEFSSRPCAQSHNLRWHGHLVDHLAIMYRACNDLLNRVSLSYVDHRKVAERSYELIRTVQSHLMYRNSVQFNRVWTESRQDWLVAMISSIMTLSGIAHGCKTRYVKKWIDRGMVYDPTGVGARICGGNLLNHSIPQKDPEHIGNTEHNARKLQITLQAVFTEIGITSCGRITLQKFVHDQNKNSSRTVYQSLSFCDKLILSQHFSRIIEKIREILPGAEESDKRRNDTEYDHKNHEDDVQDELHPFHDIVYSGDDDELDRYISSGSAVYDSIMCEESYDVMTQSDAINFECSETAMDKILRTNNPFTLAMFNLFELSQLFNPDVPGFVSRLVRFMGRVEGKELEYDLSFSGLISLVEGLGLRSDIERADATKCRNDVILWLCQRYHFPCLNSYYPNLASIDEQLLKDWDKELIRITNEARVCKVATRRLGYDRFYRNHEDVHIDIPCTGMIFCQEDKKILTPIHQKDHKDLNSALMHLSGSSDIIQNIKKSGLGASKSLCDIFLLNRNGINNPLFLHFMTVDDLLIFFGDEEKSKETKIAVITACIAYLRSKNILISYEQKRVKIFHYYSNSTKKVVTFNVIENEDDFWPIKECIYMNIGMNNKYQVGEYVIPSEKVEGCLIHKNYKRRVNCGNHPRKKLKTSKTFQKALFNLLSQHCELDHFAKTSPNDLLDLQDYCQEILRSQCTLHDMFHESLLSFYHTKGVQHFVQFLLMFRSNDPFMQAIANASISCLKYKLAIVLYTTSASGTKESYVLYFHPQVKRVYLLIEMNSFLFIDYWPNIIYFRQVFKKDGNHSCFQSWEVDAQAEYWMKLKKEPWRYLNCHMSYLDGPVKASVISYFREIFGLNLVDYSDENGLQKIELSTISKPVLIKMRVVTIFDGHALLQHALLAVFPPTTARSFIEVSAIFLKSRMSITNIIQKKVQQVMSTLLQNSVIKDYKLFTCEFQPWQRTDGMCSFMPLILYMYVGNISESFQDLIRAIEILNEEKDLISYCKTWIHKVLQERDTQRMKHNAHLDSWIHEIIDRH